MQSTVKNDPETITAPPRRERYFGRKETVTLPLEQLIVVSQVRDINNPELARLTESIDQTDLINQVDIALLDRERFIDYLDFANALWGTSHNVDDFPVTEQGQYYMVIAGHSRVQAMGILRAREQGYVDYFVECKLHRNPSPREILEIQIAENIHSQPPLERQARAMVETYEYGLRHGEWKTRQEFLRECRGHFSAHRLSQAMNFARLPAELKDFVYNGSLDYLVAVEVGRAMPVIRRRLTYQFDSYGQNIDERQEYEALLNRAVVVWAQSQIAHIQHEGLSSAKAKRLIANVISQARAETARHRGQSLLEFTMIGVNEQIQSHIEHMRTELTELLKATAHRPLSQIAHALSLHATLLGDPSLQEELIGRARHFASELGGSALTRAAQSPRLLYEAEAVVGVQY